jgi:hypothetical protein
VLRTMVAEQLSNAWNNCVTVSTNGEGLPSAKVRPSITLSAPKGEPK